MIGVRADGRKELVALADGFRESSESWADLLRDCKRRGMAAPVLAVGDGALGFWKAVRDVFPETREQRCWWHKIGNVLDRAAEVGAAGREAGAGRDLQRRGQDPRHRPRRRSFAAEFGVKWPKAAAKITDDLDVLLAFYDYPAEHWIHLRTTNPIESTFATVRLRQRVTKGPGSRAAGVAMAFKLIESAQTRWRCVNAPHLVAARPRRRHLRQRQTRRTTHRPRSTRRCPTSGVRHADPQVLTIPPCCRSSRKGRAVGPALSVRGADGLTRLTTRPNVRRCLRAFFRSVGS